MSDDGTLKAAKDSGHLAARFQTLPTFGTV
jgi:hypothetical protein